MKELYLFKAIFLSEFFKFRISIGFEQGKQPSVLTMV